MRNLATLIIVLFSIVLFSSGCLNRSPEKESPDLRVLLIAGGHKFDTNEWDSENKEYKCFKNKLKELFADWGGFLDVNLYNDGMTYFMGGKDKVIVPVDIIDNGKIIGQQKMSLLNQVTAFHFSAVANDFNNYKIHIKRLLNHSNLKTILWINFNKEKVTLTTIK